MKKANEVWTVAGKYVIITGATSGIGLAAAKELAARGAHIGIVARNEAKAQGVAERLNPIAAKHGSKVDVFLMDMASQASIRRGAADIIARWPRIDVLALNAGAMFVKRELTEDGVEKTWAVNHLGPFLLTELLIDRLRESGNARIITTSSHGHKMARRGIRFDDLDARRLYSWRGLLQGGPNLRYGETKLANILFTAELANRLAGTGVATACFDPGLVATNFNQDNGRLARATMAVMKRFAHAPEKGAETLVWLADSAEMTTATGGYYKDRQRATPSETARDTQMAKRLWEVSRKQIDG